MTDGGNEARVEHAVKESVARFVRANKDNIARSTKEKVAAASYGGGMFDVITLTRSALGRWAVEEVLRELVRWNSIKPVGGGEQVRVDVGGVDTGGLSKEDAKALGEQIAKWVEERKAKGSKNAAHHLKDPMFA